MSRYNKSYGRGKSHGAGLKFDTLLKACSNSKKPSANKTAGALGRFGIASFTSTRNVTVENSGEEESRFKFFNKRAKLSSSEAGVNKPNTYHHVNNSQNVQQSPYSVVPQPPPPAVVTPVYKPRKFFKSRDPMAATEDSSKESSVNVRPEVIAPLKIPVPRVKRDNSKLVDSPEKNSSKPLRNANNASPPQPIKLRIFKDKTTSKLVSVSEAPPPLEAERLPMQKTKVEKIPKKRGRKAKSAADSPPPPLSLPPPINQEPVPEKKSGRLTRNSRKQIVHEGTHQDPPDIHLSSVNNPPALTSFSPMDQMEQNNSVVSGGGGGSAAYPPNIFNSNSMDNRRTSCDPPPFATNTNIEKKLEEDVEFQQLSQMLSSMEEDGGSDYNNLAASYHHHPSHNHQDSYGQIHQHHQQLHLPQTPSSQQSLQQQQHHSLSQSQVQLPQSQVQQQQHHPFVQQTHIHHPVAMEYNDSQSFTQQYSTESIASLHLPVSHAATNSSSIADMVVVPNPIPVVVPPVVDVSTVPPKVRDAQDIRSILEDDWDESFEDESPKKSPPKTSRFDLSAFMHEGSQGAPVSSSPPSHHHHHQSSYPVGPSPSSANHHHYTESVCVPDVRAVAAAAGAYSHQYEEQEPTAQLNFTNPYAEASQQPALAAPFNAPYAVRNLLSSTKEFQSQSQQQQQQLNSNFSQETDVISSRFVVPGSDSGKDSFHNNNSNNSIEKPGGVLNLSVNPVLPSGGSSALQSSHHHSTATTKKASIFKSRAQTSGETGEKGTQGNPKKRLALYKHKFGQGDGDEESKSAQDPTRPGAPSSVYKDEFDDSDSEDPGSLRRVTTSEAGNEGKKTTKNLYSVIRNVKPIHELQESGEFHEFDGDVWYILDELKEKNPITNRCLSAITLATRCMEPAFRMHLRAHGTVAEFCKELHDAPANPILALLASTVLFVLSQDRLNMDLDTDSLKLIIALTKAGEATNIADDSPEIAKLAQRVIDLVSEMKNRGHAKHLKVEKITASELALETLLYLTSKRAGDFLKHELRTLGGLDYIVTEVVTSLEWLRLEVPNMGFSEGVIDRLWKIDRCLQVVQQVTFNHEENQRYLLGVSDSKSGSLKPQGSPEIFISLFRFCNDQLSCSQRNSEPAKVLHEILFSLLRVLVNLSHDYRGIVLGSEILCAMDGFLPLCLHSVFHMSINIPDEKVFDLLMHSLCMLLNLVEYSKGNRNAILSSTVRRAASAVPAPLNSSWSSEDSGVEEEQPTLDALVEMFVSKERAAQQDEASTDDILTKGSDGKKPNQKGASGSQNSQNSQNPPESESSNSVQDTIDKLIATAGKHMENSLIAAYISLLLAYLIMDDPAAATTVRNSMPNQRYLPLMVVLKKLFNFMSITSSASGSLRGLKATAIALKFYEKSDPESKEELKKIIPD